MKVLFLGDVHIKHNNLSELEILLNVIPTIKESIDFIVVAGDVLDSHEKIDSQLLNRAYNLIKTLRQLARVYILVGNHDYINNQQFLTENHWMNGMKEWSNVIVCDIPLRIRNDFIVIPYVYPGRFVEALNTIGRFQSVKCIFAHQEIKGCKMGAIVSSQGDAWDLNWPHIISGHIHENQRPQKNVYYPGSALNHAFGYDSQGLSIFTFSDDCDAYEEIKVELGLPKKKTIFMSLHDNIEEPDKVTSNRFSLLGDASEISQFKKTDKYKELKKSNIKIVFRLKPSIIDNDSSMFLTILNDLISKENNIEMEMDLKSIIK
jgi:DNA repair exonuclease SbcCD nuclease subunit